MKNTTFLYETYSKEKEQIKELLGSIKPMINIYLKIIMDLVTQKIKERGVI